MVPSPVTLLGYLSGFRLGPRSDFSADATAIAARQTGCATGVHMIVARASTEQPGTGIIGAVARDIQSQIPGSDIEAVDYPAVLNPYQPSQTEGVAAMTQLVQDYATRCPGSKMVLMGYSQGAHVAADVLCGASARGFPATQPLAAGISDNVAAVVLMGDPSHVAGQPINQGSSRRNGVFPRRNTAACGAVANRMVSFCDSGDPFCDGGLRIAVHLSYVQKFGDEATTFVVEQVNST